MNSKLKLVVCLSVTFFSTAPFAQVASTSVTISAPSVAYVYVTSRPANASANEIDAYAAAPNGALTPVEGSPFQENEFTVTADGRYLFGSSATPRTSIRWRSKPTARCVISLRPITPSSISTIAAARVGCSQTARERTFIRWYTTATAQITSTSRIESKSPREN